MCPRAREATGPARSDDRCLITPPTLAAPAQMVKGSHSASGGADAPGALQRALLAVLCPPLPFIGLGALFQLAAATLVAAAHALVRAYRNVAPAAVCSMWSSRRRCVHGRARALRIASLGAAFTARAWVRTTMPLAAAAWQLPLQYHDLPSCARAPPQVYLSWAAVPALLALVVTLLQTGRQHEAAAAAAAGLAALLAANAAVRARAEARRAGSEGAVTAASVRELLPGGARGSLRRLLGCGARTAPALGHMSMDAR